MAYCDYPDILGAMDEEDVIAYTNDGDGDSVNMARVDQAVAGATALIDSHLGRRYGLPLNPIPEVIRDLAVDIAVYKIAGRKSDPGEEWRLKYKDAVRMLERMADGKAVVPGAVAVASGAGDHSVSFSSNSRVFGRDSMGGW